MCGICGFTGTNNIELLKQMAGLIKHRGPDDEGLWCGNMINLASRRLSIVDIDGGKQPMCDISGIVHIAWNGEVYNHRQLRQGLEAKGYIFKTSHSDTEVLLNMYLEYGEGFVSRLNGMFAIAIWDERSPKLLLYRDRLGVKPLYYTDTGGIIFASEIKAILLHPAYKCMVNDKAIYQYFSYKNICAPETAFAGIYEVMPGQKFVYADGKISKSFYWNTDTFYENEKVPFDDKFSALQHSRIIDGITEKLDWLICDAVKIRLDADTEIGSFLSGGLDSSLVSVLAARNTSRLKCFTLGHEARCKQGYDKQSDVDNASMVSEKYNMKQYLKVISASDVIEKLEDIEKCFDQPFSGALSMYIISEAMSGKVKTALSGDGADELFGSYLPHMLSFPMEHYSAHIQNDIPLINSKLKPFENETAYIKSMYSFSEGDETLLSYRMLLMTDDEKKLFLGERFERFADEKLSLQLVKIHRAGLHGKDVLNRNLEYDCKVLLPNQVLKYADALSMAHSVEVRNPFLDYRIVEYIAGISGKYKIYNGETKYLLKTVAQKYLPKELVCRKKEGFTMPVNDWMQDELKEYVLDILTPGAVAEYGFIRPEAVYFILKKYYGNPSQNSHLAGIIWNFLCFQKWCRAYL